MTKLDFESLAREAREEVLPGPPPLDQITTGRGARAVTTVLAAAAAVVLVIVTLVAWPHFGGNARPSTPVPSGAQRWVAAGDVMLRVPASWADSQYGCETDPRPAVVYDASYWTSCQDTSLGRQRQPSAMWVLSMEHPRETYGGYLYPKATQPVSGLDARRSSVFAQEGASGKYWYQVLVIPETHAMFVAQSTSRSEVERLIASARAVPAGSAGPPPVAGQDLTDARATLAAYHVQVREERSPYRRGTVIGSEPAFGTPLRAGDAVTLTVSSGLGDAPVMSDAFLTHHRFQVEPLGALTPEEQAQIRTARAKLVADLAGSTNVFDAQLVLRRVTKTYPRSHGVPVYRHRLVWLVLQPRVFGVSLGPCCSATFVERDVAMYNGLTGRWLTETQF